MGAAAAACWYWGWRQYCPGQCPWLCGAFPDGFCLPGPAPKQQLQRGFVAQSMPVLMQQQSPVAMLGVQQQQQQVMMQPVGGQLAASFSGNDGRGSHSGYFSPPAGASELSCLSSAL